jgi:hypothetical protein
VAAYFACEKISFYVQIGRPSKVVERPILAGTSFGKALS